MTFSLTHDYLVADRDLYARHLEIGNRALHPTGEHTPVAESERRLTPLHRWERMVQEVGSNVALEEEGRTLTYVEVNAQANRLAHAILAHNVHRELPVAMLFDLEWDLPIAILAIWKAGNPFVWLETRQPVARNRYMAQESDAPLVITNRRHAEVARELWQDARHVLVIEELAESLPTSDPPITITPDTPAYLMYTSGSTGKPKGTVDVHRNLMQLMMERTNAFHFSTHDRIALLVLGGGCHTVFCAWMYGGCLLPFHARNEGLARLNRWIIEQRITVLLDAAMLRTWLLALDGRDEFPHVRLVILGAGPTYREHVAAFQRYLPEPCVLTNLYSATEVRSITMLFMDKSTRLETRLVPVGYAPPWATVEIWDEQANALPVDAVGEIVVFTPYAAWGYWKSPELSATKFGVDAQGRRFCRMGDLGKLDAQHCLWVMGRKDGQVKIRDNRVETAEVEVALLELPNVDDVAVIALGEGDESQKLVAFAVTRAGVGDELRKQLAMRLPDYMIPSFIYRLDEMPRNGNGKIDRPLLRERVTALQAAQDERPVVFRTETEARVAALLADLLPGGRVGPDDNFFDVGGHSLMAARLMLRIQRTFGVDLPPRDFFAQPTVAALALSLDGVLKKPQLPTHPAKTRIEAVQLVRGSDEFLPIFLCPGGNGSLTVVLRYQQLIHRLGKQWPLVSLVTAESDLSSGLYTTVDELVGEALAALRGVQPHGPYLLLGECIGGKLAYEMARVLVQVGERVAMLTLLDTPMQPSRSDGKALWQRWQDRARALWQGVAARRAATTDADSLESRTYLAQRRYLELLTRFRPDMAYPHPATAIFTHEYAPHQPAWSALMAGLAVTVVAGQHNDYLRVSGEEVAKELRARIAAAQP